MFLNVNIAAPKFCEPGVKEIEIGYSTNTLSVTWTSPVPMSNGVTGGLSASG